MTRANITLVTAAAFFCTLLAVRLVAPPSEVASSAVASTQLNAGDRLPDFWMDWAPAQKPDGVTLVMLFTAECPWCRASVPRWNELRSDVQQRAPGTHVVGVSLSGPMPTDTFVTASTFAAPVAFPRDRNGLVAKWKVERVPYTVLLAPDGEVLGAWNGLVDSTTKSLVLAVLEQR